MFFITDMYLLRHKVTHRALSVRCDLVGVKFDFVANVHELFQICAKSDNNSRPVLHLTLNITFK
jgi:hypothetical protein